ncbi:MAG: VWA domain-containing protein [Phycisphaerales bacterium]|nr:VWA domain-containing protein [Phycisphaerales bacterium]
MTRIPATAFFAVLAGTTLGALACPPAQIAHEIIPDGEFCGTVMTVEQQSSIDVVFVLDTTGSMGGLIDGAKEKIWAIANQIAMADPSPKVRMGLVGYRDRGDKYVTTITQLTDDIDTVYADLMAYQAQGGGDTPESVNEALFQAVERFEWTTEENALKLIYLVGDAPPKMGYADDVKYQASCRLAYEQGININTIQCGTMEETRVVWQEVAQLANGMYAAIEQSGGVIAVSTPFDEQIAKLDAQINKTMLDYGDAEVFAYQESKRERSDAISGKAAPSAAADRAVYNLSDAGRSNVFGLQELVDDVINERVKLDEIPNDELPEQLRSMSTDEMREVIDERKAERDELSAKIKQLAKERASYLKAHNPSPAMDSFDQKVLEALVEQGARVGIKFESESAIN